MDAPTETTLEQLDGSWPEPGPDATGLMRQVHAARRVPIERLSAGDLRVLLGQQESIETLVPRALDLLGREPLVEGDYYPGDLLAATLRVPEAHWSTHPEQRDRLRAVLGQVDLQEPGVADTQIPELATEFLAR